MTKNNALIFKFLFLLFTLSLWGCSGGSASSSFGLPSASIIPDETIAGSSNGVTSPNQFYIGIDSEINSISHVHASGDFSRACSMLPTDASKDITCIIESPEAEFFQKGLGMKYNVPPDMCYYFERSTYWYYKKEVGFGPTNISVFQEYSTDTTLLINYSTSVDSSPNTTTLSYPEVEIDINSSPPKLRCIYDRSSLDDSNCCSGSYSLSLRKLTHPSSTLSVDLTTVTSHNWGPADSSCIGGAGSEWSKKTSTGIPMIITELSRKGLIDQSYTVSSPNSLGLGSNRHLVNFYKPELHTHTGFGPVMTPPIVARTSNLPYFIDPIDDRNGTTISAGSDSYDFVCKDQAYETLRKIKVYVREWDTYQDYVTFITSKGTSGNPDRGSETEGPGCGDDVLSSSERCNDFYDLDDFVTLQLSGSYPTTLPSVPARGSYFPYD